MKKLLLPVGFLFSVAMNAFAQAPVVDNHPLNKAANTVEKTTPKTLNKGDVSTWYNHLDMIPKSNVGASLQNFVAFMQHDSNSLYYNADGERLTGVGRVSIGQVCDPKDDLIDQTDNPLSKLSKFVSYKMDSVRFAYLYVRNVDSVDDGIGGKMPVVDTLYVSYFKGTQITKPGISGSQTKIASVGWTGGNVRFPLNFFDTDTFLLTRNDSTVVNNNNGGFENSWRIKVLTIPAPAGMTVDAQQGANTNNLVATTLTFKSGIKTIEGADTAIMIWQKDPATLPAGARRTNYFGYYYASNQGTTRWENLTFYNSSLIGIARAAYAPFNGWNGYINGAAFINEQFADIDFHLTSTSGNVGISEIKNNGFAMSNIYPNPARTSEKAVVGFNLKNKSTVAIAIVNLVGQEVKSVLSKNFDAGLHSEYIDITGLKPGVYFVTMTVNGNTSSKKLTITE